MQSHVHTTGATSYANIRADFEDKNKRDPSNLEIFRHTHRKKDGTFVKDTLTEDLLGDADANVETQIDFNPSSTKSRVDIENEVFNKLMYGDDIPKRPMGYGYGVKQSDIFGVRSILRKERFNDTDNNTVAVQKMGKAVSVLLEENKELKTKYDETNKLVKTMATQFGQILDVLSTGNAPTDFLDIAKGMLHKSQVSDLVNDHGAPK